MTVGALAGIGMAIVLDRIPYLEAILTPYLILLVTTPMIALVPVLFLVFGVSIWPKLLVVALGSGPTIMMNTLTGLRRTPAIRLELMRALHASPNQTMLRVKLPGAAPMILTGCLIGSIFGTITAVGAEFVGGNSGLGAVIVANSQLIQTDVVGAAVVLLALSGLAFYFASLVIGRRIAGWSE